MAANQDARTRETWRLTAMVGTPRYSTLHASLCPFSTRTMTHEPFYLLVLPILVAPEVALGLPYNESCDVYSFGIVLWQIMTLNTKTYGSSNRKKAIDYFVKSVWDGPQKRPSMVLKSRTVRRNFLPCLQTLVPSCWSHDWQSRPTMEQVESLLRDEVLHGSMVTTGGDGISTDDNDMLFGDSFETTGDVIQSSDKAQGAGQQGRRPTGPLSLSVAVIRSMRNLCQSTRSGTMLPGRLSKKQQQQQQEKNTLPANKNMIMRGGAMSADDLVSFSSLSCPIMRQGRRLTHQSRRSTFCLDIHNFSKSPQDTERSVDYSDFADFEDDDEDVVDDDENQVFHA